MPLRIISFLVFSSIITSYSANQIREHNVIQGQDICFSCDSIPPEIVKWRVYYNESNQNKSKHPFHKKPEDNGEDIDCSHLSKWNRILMSCSTDNKLCFESYQVTYPYKLQCSDGAKKIEIIIKYYRKSLTNIPLMI